MSITKSFFALSLMCFAIIETCQAGSYSYTTGILVLDRVKVDTAKEHYYAQFSLRYLEPNNTFTGLGMRPLADNFPFADATLTLDASNNYILTILNASGYSGIMRAKALEGPFSISDISPIVSSPGVIGPIGDRGPTGPKGDIGDIGDTGAKGAKGDTGETGAKGDKGDIGDTGVKGAKGDTGDTGAKGDKGDIGDAGVKGAKGDIGDTGAKGDKGDIGDTGLSGDDGLTVTVNSISQVSGNITLTKANFGLADVDNTSDANKPISTTTQTALDTKAPLANPIFTGIPNAPTPPLETNTTQLATTAFVTAAVNRTGFSYKIGDTGPGGGTIFFVDYYDEYPGFNYLEAAPTDLADVVWCNNANTLIADLAGWAANGIGRGQANTNAMLAVCTSGAAQEANLYSNNGKDDWFLPSASELRILGFNLSGMGSVSLTQADYWSSNELDATEGIELIVKGGAIDNFPKSTLLPARAIRAF